MIGPVFCCRYRQYFKMQGKGQTLERPNPKTETVDKVLTPTSIKDTERQTDAINEQAAKAERKLGH